MREIYEEMLSMLREGKPGVLVTVTAVKGSVPRHAGSKMIVRGDGSIFGTVGGGKVEADIISAAVELLGTREPVKREYLLTEEEDILCGGKMQVLLEPFGILEQAFVFGAGHVGRALAPLLKQAGFRLVVVDDRPEFANPERFPDADELKAGPFGEMLRSLRFTENTYIVVVTHGHRHDEEVIEYCLRQPFRYLGMIGSRKKTKTILRRLREKGFSDGEIRRIHSPIGLNIGAETPFEIGISILAEIIAVRRGANVAALSMRLNKET